MIVENSGACFGSTFSKIRTIQRRLAWPCARVMCTFVKQTPTPNSVHYVIQETSKLENLHFYRVCKL